MSSCNALIKKPEDRRYLRRCRVVVGCSLALYIACSQASLHMGPKPLGFALAALGSLAFCGEVIAVGFLVMKQLDEFQRVLMTRAFLWASTLTLLLAAAYGNLQLYNAHDIPALGAIWIPVTVILLTSLFKVTLFLRHRSPID